MVSVLGSSIPTGGGYSPYIGLSPSLIEAASTTAPHVSTRFADLVLLANPAFEATRYLPIYDLLRDGADANRVIEQPPVFVCATAINDRATGVSRSRSAMLIVS